MGVKKIEKFESGISEGYVIINLLNGIQRI